MYIRSAFSAHTRSYNMYSKQTNIYRVSDTTTTTAGRVCGGGLGAAEEPRGKGSTPRAARGSRGFLSTRGRRKRGGGDDG